MKDEQEKKPLSPIRLAEIDAQQKIMARVDELMSEAARPGAELLMAQIGLFGHNPPLIFRHQNNLES